MRKLMFSFPFKRGAILRGICSLTLLFLIWSQGFSAYGESGLVHNNEVIVKMKSGKSVSDLSKAISKRVELLYTLPLSYTTYELVQAPEGVDPFVFSLELVRSGLVEFAYPNVKKQVSSLDELQKGSPFIPNDPYFLGEGNASLEEAFDNPRRNQWGLLYTNAPFAWKFTTGRDDVVVAVIDTGIVFLHPELEGRLWENPGEIPGNGRDDDANGFVDDIYGYDFADWDQSRGRLGDPDVTDEQAPYESHGTWVAGVIGARGNNREGIAGVAGGGNGFPGVRLMIIRVGTNSDISVAAEAAALDYAVSNGAKIINISFGGEPGGEVEENAVRDAWNRGAVIIAAGGNEPVNSGRLDWPAALPQAICVGATTIFAATKVNPATQIINETIADYSKTGPEMDVVAPGTNILTIHEDDAYTFHPDFQFTGTSASTPIVAGFAALILSHYPNFNNTQLRDKIYSSTIDMGASGWDEVYGHGRIDMAKAFPQQPPQGRPGDYDRDGDVDEDDVLKIIQHFGHISSYDGGTPTDSEDDIIDGNQDGIVDELDIFVIGRNYTGSSDSEPSRTR